MSPDLRCPACGNPSRDGGLCDTDEKTLAAALKQAPDLLDELLTQATRQAVTSLASGKSPDTPLPINLVAADLAAKYEALLLSWARASDWGVIDGDGRRAARWLAEHFYVIRIQPDIDGRLDELTTHARKCMVAIDRHGADMIYIGDCTALLPPNDIQCRTPLRVKRGLRTAACWRCEATYDVTEMLEKRDAEIDSSLATALEIARVGFRTPDGRLIGLRMIEGYAARGSIAAHGSRYNATLRRDVAIYRIGDVKEAAFRARYPKAQLPSRNERRSA